MGKPAAKEGDKVVAIDTHIVMMPSPVGPVPTPTPMPFNGILIGELASSVFIDGAAVALEGSKAQNMPPHLPLGGPFQKPPKNEATITQASATVVVDGKGVARATDTARTCNDPADADLGSVIA
ncbi:MAG: hypothetical protein EXR75_14735, partial [Myxococcales bacterium]|nr:hypothetical protein [Myxococcales bacterium]